MKAKDLYNHHPQQLGRGGYATVWKAIHKETGQEVALKQSRKDKESRARLRREIDALRKLRHERIMPLLQASPLQDWYTMPLAVGSLASLRDTLDETERLRAIQHAATGLAFAHELGFVHRDVTPSNILAFREADGSLRWVMADWGLVRRPPGHTSQPLTRGGGLGTEAFRAPEAWEDGRELDARADIYSLGRVAEWVSTGKRLVPNVPRITPGPLKPFVQGTTQLEPESRPRNMVEAMELLPQPQTGRRSTARQALVWQEDARQKLVTTWLELDGADTRVLGRMEGLLFCQEEHLWQWRTSTRPILVTEYVPFDEERKPRLFERELEDAHLDHVLRGRSHQLSHPYPPKYATEHELERGMEVIGSLGRLLFISGQEYTYTGGAHGNREFDFQVFDVESEAWVESLSAREVEATYTSERESAFELFRALEATESIGLMLESPEDVSLTLYRPLYDGNGQLLLELQFTASCSYGSSDGLWSSYTVSRRMTTARIPEPLRELPAPSDGLSQALAATHGSRRMGWSLVGPQPAVRDWLEQMLVSRTTTAERP